MNAPLRRLTTALGAAGIMLGSVSCGEALRQGRSPSILVIDSLQAASGATPSELGGFLHSDVLTNDGIFNDVGQAALRTVLKDLGNPGSQAGPSEVNAITVSRVRIVYLRTDGRNVPGVDVPYPIDVATTGTITFGGSTISFEIVRHQAKLEAPLRALIGLGGRVFISTIADVTFYGADLAGNAVQATGQISVDFADFADP